MNNIDIFNQHFLGKSPGLKKPKISNINAVIYTRVSSLEQARTNNSLETQLKKCRELGKNKNYRIIKEFGNTHESAKTDNRVEFQKMLEFVRKSYKGKSEDQINIIVIYSFDRFSRTGLQSLSIVEELAKLG